MVLGLGPRPELSPVRVGYGVAGNARGRLAGNLAVPGGAGGGEPGAVTFSKVQPEAPQPHPVPSATVGAVRSVPAALDFAIPERAAVAN
jgi:hypothetical protein